MRSSGEGRNRSDDRIPGGVFQFHFVCHEQRGKLQCEGILVAFSGYAGDSPAASQRSVSVTRRSRGIVRKFSTCSHPVISTHTISRFLGVM